MVRGRKPGKSLKAGQPAGSVEPPEGAGPAPDCAHGVKRAYKSINKRDGSVGHLWECTAYSYPDERQCAAEWINLPKKGN